MRYLATCQQFVRQMLLKECHGSVKGNLPDCGVKNYLLEVLG